MDYSWCESSLLPGRCQAPGFVRVARSCAAHDFAVANERFNFRAGNEDRPARLVEREALLVECSKSVGAKINDLLGFRKTEKIKASTGVQVGYLS